MPHVRPCSTCGATLVGSRVCENCGADNRPGVAAREFPATGPSMTRTAANELIAEAVLDPQDVLTSLAPPGRSIDDIAKESRSGSGVYAIYGDQDAWKALRLELSNGPLYVGKKETSASGRLLREHFAVSWTANGSPTGHSTFRRSLAGGLRELLDLGPGAPRTKSNPGYFNNFGLADEDADHRLSQWMRAHLSCTVWATPPRLAIEVLRAAESEAIRILKPPLNGALPPHIKEGRRRFAAEARKWGAEV